MKGRSRIELYKAFMDFISDDIQRERHAANRRMLSVFLWSLILPAVTSLTLILLVNAGVLPRSARGYLDWTILVFPVAYSLYLLSSEVLVQIPNAIRRGGVASSVSQALKEGEWRERVSESMRRALSDADASDWKWLSFCFGTDLEKMRYRTKYLTALAGAVFYLLLQGIDFLGDSEQKVSWVRSPMGWIESSSNDFSQFIGLGLFLTLFYLSGSQTYHSLARYLHCAQLAIEPEEKKPEQV